MPETAKLPKGVILHKGQIYAQFTDSEGKRKRLRATNVNGALTILLEQSILKRHLNKLPPEQRPRPAARVKSSSFRELARTALFYSEQNNKASSTKELGYKVTTLLEDFGDRDGATITKGEIRRYLNDQATEKKWKAATYNRWQAALSLIFRLAVENEIITTNPAAFKRKRETRGRDRFLSADEEVKLLDALRKNSPQHIPATLIALYTGMRAGEQFGLKWKDVDLANRTVTLEKTKNGDVRYVRLSPTALKAFETLHEIRPTKNQEDFVFLSYKGTQLLDHRSWFNKAVADSGIERIVWHGLRHTCASRMVMKGTDLRTVGKQLGHRTFQITMRYAHLAKDHEQAAIDLLG